MNARVLSFPAATEVLCTARQVVAQPDPNDRDDVIAACRYLMTYGDYMDYVRATALLDVLEAEVLIARQRSLPEIAAGVPGRDWAAGAAILVLAVALFWVGYLL
jgi:hypothetical protein